MMAKTNLPRVLCVDDEPNMLSALRRQMRSKFNIATASSVEDGLEILNNQGPFDVVISDFRMPDTNGAEFLRKVKEIDPTATRILLTGEANVEEMQSAVNEGQIYKVLLKPCSPDDLREAMSGAVKQHVEKKSANEQVDELLKSLAP
ncbi:MAG: hypothetical protein BMS9Abin36_1888 [Gammaproteobacteria bacterium]|nr:MAG: hypothetical protein BMS9Abin36_1888 [Gammaproteobacteria bacterium]